MMSTNKSSVNHTDGGSIFKENLLRYPQINLFLVGSSVSSLVKTPSSTSATFVQSSNNSTILNNNSIILKRGTPYSHQSQVTTTLLSVSIDLGFFP